MSQLFKLNNNFKLSTKLSLYTKDMSDVYVTLGTNALVISVTFFKFIST